MSKEEPEEIERKALNTFVDKTSLDALNIHLGYGARGKAINNIVKSLVHKLDELRSTDIKAYRNFMIAVQFDNLHIISIDPTDMLSEAEKPQDA